MKIQIKMPTFHCFRGGNFKNHEFLIGALIEVTFVNRNLINISPVLTSIKEFIKTNFMPIGVEFQKTSFLLNI